METQSNFLFVYGSLLSGFKSPAYEYLSKYFKLIGEGWVNGTIYDMGTYPVGTSIDTGRIIRGELYEVNNHREQSFVMAQLDDYEGMHPDEGEDTYYRREIVKVNCKTGSEVEAWIYWYNKDISNQPILESDNLKDYLVDKKHS